MELPRKVDLPYSWKNIPIPSHDAYRKKLIEMVESLIKRMRWKAFFFLRGDKDEKQDCDEKFGLKSRRCPPQIDELKPFEDDMTKLIEDLEFTSMDDDFQRTLRNDTDKIRNSATVFVPADKTHNLYEMETRQYDKLLRENITKHYKRAPAKAYDLINTEARKLADQLKIADRMDILAKQNAFVTLKDHKENFTNNLPCRLINPAKNEIGLVSKRILDRVNTELRSKLNIQQWKNASEVIDWFSSIDRKDQCVFTCFDICEFYPSISEELLCKSLTFAQRTAEISKFEQEIIFHARKSLLFSNGNDWTKKSGMFDVTMGSHDGAEVCDLVGIYSLATLPTTSDIGLYRDDGLAVHRNVSGSDADRSRKDLAKHFKSLGLKITIQTNLKITNFLDLTLDLNSGKYYPFRKPNDTPYYVHKRSNHPPAILKNIPAAISRRITDLSSDKDAFMQAAPLYNDALKASGYSENIQFLESRKEKASTARKRRQRSRKVIWFNPPYSRNVKTCVGKKFLKLVNKHFPKGSNLSKIFNRSTLKVSYSCMANVATILKTHNKHVLRRTELTSPSKPQKLCNCRKPEQCPLNGECLATSLVYRASVKAADSEHPMHYYGITEGTFKQRYANHLTSFRHERHSNATELSKHIWGLKEKDTDYEISWTICKRVPAYSSASRSCQLCLTEKLYIITADRRFLLNKRSELVSTCRHRRKFLLSNHVNGT